MKKQIKKWMTLFIMSTLILLLVACGKKEEASQEEPVTASENAVVEKETDDIDSDTDADAGDEEKTDELASANNDTDGDLKTPVEAHGKLSVDGTDLVDEKGDPFHIHGVSTHGINWFPGYVNEDAFRQMRDEWGVNCIRLAMYTVDYNGYCAGGSQESLKALVNNGVSYATDLGMYVIIDWHILNDLDPNVHKEEAIAYFDEMSKTYKDSPNVLYEICNEPNGGTTWDSVKSYAEEVIPVIKANDPDAIIIVGTPNWSQDVDIASKNQITGYSNIMYTIHFYADTHKDDIRNKVKSAHEAGLPIFCTEFGICDAAGSGANNKDEAAKWISLFDDYNISYCIWNLSNKNETSALIKSSCSKTSGWTQDDLSDSGVWYTGILKERDDVVIGTYPDDSQNSGDQNSGESNTDDQNSGNQDSSQKNNADKNSNQQNNSQQNNNQNSGTSQGAVATANSGNIKVSLVPSGGWNDGKKDFVQYTVKLENTGSSTVSGWTVTVDLKTDCALDQSWNGDYSVSGQKLTITPADFNKDISKGSAVEVGFIVSVSDASKTPSVSVK